ncbi:MAG: hypothetical protein KGI71_06250 [Patescibacteria group bacterium]|nr:hypothetical protein [Patescibacteria group bacterium]
MNANEQPKRVAYCLTRPAWWKYESADSHCDASEFRKRQYARLIAAQPALAQAQQQDREAA